MLKMDERFILSPFLRLLFLLPAGIISVSLHMHFLFSCFPLILLLVLVNSDWSQQYGIQPSTHSNVCRDQRSFSTV